MSTVGLSLGINYTTACLVQTEQIVHKVGILFHEFIKHTQCTLFHEF